VVFYFERSVAFLAGAFNFSKYQRKEAPMRIINILGSPRSSGNGATIAQLLLDALAKPENQINTHALNTLGYRGCQACMSCKKTTDRCAVKDDLTPVLEDVRAADVVILSTPVYFGEITAQAKGFVDRLYSFLGPDYRTNPHSSRLSHGKQLVLILPQGNPDETAFADLIPRYTRRGSHSPQGRCG
jgi:multimeric flavodoxin WrbA